MAFPFLKSLRGRLIALLLLVFVPAAALIVFIHLHQRQDADRQTRLLAQRVISLVQQKEQAIIGGAHALVAALSVSEPVRSARSRGCSEQLAGLLRDQSVFVNIGIVDAQGNLLCSAIPAGKAVSFADRPWFIRARTLKRFSVGDYAVSRISGERTVAYAHPLHGPDGRFDGAVFASARFAWLTELVRALDLPADFSVEVVDRDGRILERQPPLAADASLAPPLVNALRQPAPGLAEADGPDGRHRLYAHAPLAVASHDLYVMVGLPDDHTFAAIYRPLWENLAFLLVMALLAGVGIWLAVDGMVLRAMNQLIGFSERLAGGDFSARNETRRGVREFDRLAEAFDQMAAGLEQRENAHLRTEQALRASEERFRSIAESSSVGIFRTDGAGRCIYVNQQWCDVTGLTPELAFGQGWMGILHPVDRARVSRRWEQAVSRRERFRDEFRFIHQGGRETWVLGEALPENEREGGFVGTFTDISDRVQAENRLRTTEERFRVFMANNPAACWILDEHGRYVYLNKALAEMLDGTESSLAGGSIFDLYPPDLAREYDEANRQVLRDGRVLETVERAPRRDGSIGDFATFRFALRDSNGRDVVGGMSIDVTERTRMAQALKSSEERFREFMDNNPALCWISDESGRITYVNKTFGKTLKLSLDPVGRHPIELFATPVARQHVYGIKMVSEKMKSTETQERFLRSDGSEGDFTVFRFPLVGAEGRRSVGGVAIDITERRRAADDLRDANVRLQALSNRVIEVQETERRQLARELHDEIGQCLTALKINLEGLQRTAKEPAVVNRIAESVELSAHTLEQVRRLSVDLRPSQLDDLGLEPAVRSILNRQASTGKFIPHYESDFDGEALSDQVETACFRVCQEALTNIIKHAGAQNVWVRIEQRGQKLQLRVRDDGRGFDPEQGNRQAIAGDSFGLLGMQERAMLAGGQLEIHSTPGQGTEVQAWFSVTQTSMDGRP